jgi:hypothetical protein
LIATYENRHVLVSTIYSKSALRVVAEIAAQQRPDVAYFPAYELITGPQARSRYFEDDLRNVSEAGVSHVMAIFSRHFLAPPDQGPTTAEQDNMSDLAALQEIVCDEEVLDP